MLEKMGADVTFGPNSITVSRRADSPLIGVDEDCGDIPDVAMTLAVVGLFAKVIRIVCTVCTDYKSSYEEKV